MDIFYNNAFETIGLDKAVIKSLISKYETNPFCLISFSLNISKYFFKYYGLLLLSNLCINILII